MLLNGMYPVKSLKHDFFGPGKPCNLVLAGPGKQWFFVTTNPAYNNPASSIKALKSSQVLSVNVMSECGGGFTSKLEGMFKDMELSKDIICLLYTSPSPRDS